MGNLGNLGEFVACMLTKSAASRWPSDPMQFQRLPDDLAEKLMHGQPKIYISYVKVTFLDHLKTDKRLVMAVRPMDQRTKGPCVPRFIQSFIQ